MQTSGVIQTARLDLRRMTDADAGFILRLLNEPSFLEFVGDKGIRTLDDARRYVQEGPAASYREHGFGLYLVERRDEGVPIGICGLLQRDSLDDVDLGFALIPEVWSQGYASEAGRAVLTQARDEHGLSRVVAITSSNNDASIRVLETLGFRFETMVRLSDQAPEVRLFAIDFPAGSTAPDRSGCAERRDAD